MNLARPEGCKQMFERLTMAVKRSAGSAAILAAPSGILPDGL